MAKTIFLCGLLPQRKVLDLLNIMQKTLYKRHIADEITKYLFTNDIIVLHGARQVGKTHILYYFENLLKKQGEIAHYIDLEDSRLARILDKGVDEFIKYLNEQGFDITKIKQQNSKIFVLIDEIQYLLNPSLFLKLIADHYPEIKLIVSGSSSFNIKSKFKDSLVGRTVNFDIFNLSFEEFLDFKEYYFKKEESYTEKKIGELVSLYQEYCLYGGYPKIVMTPEIELKEKYLQQIIDTYIKKDIRDLANIKDIRKLNQILEALAAQSGQLLDVTELSNTCKLSKRTVENYLFLLEQTYIIKLVRPYSGNLRSELSKTAKIFFYDTGLMQMLWLKELPKEILGSVFETSVFVELAKKYGTEKITYWRTTDKKEIDFVVKSKEGLLPIEVKLNFSKFQKTAVEYFIKRYRSSPYKVVGLRGDIKNNFIYPWQL